MAAPAASEAAPAEVGLEVRRMAPGAAPLLIDVSRTTTIAELKRTIEERIGVAPAQQRLLRTGQVLRDATIVADAGLTNVAGERTVFQLVESEQRAAPEPAAAPASAPAAAPGAPRPSDMPFVKMMVMGGLGSAPPGLQGLLSQLVNSAGPPRPPEARLGGAGGDDARRGARPAPPPPPSVAAASAAGRREPWSPLSSAPPHTWLRDAASGLVRTNNSMDCLQPPQVQLHLHCGPNDLATLPSQISTLQRDLHREYNELRAESGHATVRSRSRSIGRDPDRDRRSGRHRRRAAREPAAAAEAGGASQPAAAAGEKRESDGTDERRRKRRREDGVSISTLRGKTRRELAEFCAERGIDVSEGLKKEELVDAIINAALNSL
eukprot:TRINITY_DN52235_c0_g1_i1.p1 TRINITY_DN52235_c0_g1~~TRINITY_DN52235_c0_g1_i1.p1  ORF type:complete len:379 (+),score=65.71 TRINITY_DN52235_c0_g1_i1:110-1246(+)